MKKLLIALLLLPALLQSAYAKERWYQVEVIIFAQNNSDYHKSERWGADYTLPDFEGSRRLSASSSGPTAFSRLPVTDLKLGGAAAQIKRASDVKLIRHFGWLQPGLEEKKALSVRITDAMPGSGDIGSRLSPPRLDGTLRLILSRYLHLQSDLIWYDPLNEEELAALEALSQHESEADVDENVAPTTFDESPLNTHLAYRLQQSRRMRSNEIHYIDHPRFGLIVQVTPYEGKTRN